jgi:cell division protein FtsN
VQVAAFDRAAPADDLARKLRADGFDARVDADEKWHRVRIGHYPTRAAAAAEARTLKARGVTGFVTGSGE